MKRFTLILITLSLLLASCTGNTSDTSENTAVNDTTASTDKSESTVTDHVSDTVGDSIQTEKNETASHETEEDVTIEIPEFKSDLSEYEKYMQPEDRDGYLILVNKDNPLPDDYVPEGMVDVVDTRDDGRDMQKMCLYASKALEAMLIEARANGCKKLSVTSAYRSYDYQYRLYNQYIDKEMSRHPSWSREEAIAEVNTYSAIAGTSEHQTGLACDMHNLSSAKVEFADTPESEWLENNCYKFGFILRYEEDKMDITGGIIYEPWHFRYVGRYHATRMHELDMCLEEYLEYLNNN